MSYWGSEGKYQSQSDQISKDVPASGHAQNVAVELYRCAQNVYYEIYNNGGGNMGCDAYQNNDHEFSKNTQLRHIASYGIELWKDGGFMDEMMNSVIEKCKALGYPFKEDLED